MNRWITLYGDLRLPTYLTMIVVGLCLATFVVRREARRSEISQRAIFDVALVLVPCAFVFGRLAIAAQDPFRWLPHLDDLIWHGGFVFYGSFVGVVIGLWLASRWRGLDVWTVLDIFATAMPFGVVFGRLGCLGAGCCHGRPADWPLGVNVPWSVAYYQHNLPVPEPMLAVQLHPTPVYDSLCGLLLFVLLSRLRARKPPSGVTFAWLLIGYATLRAFTECFRGDLQRGLWFADWLSTAQLTGAVLASFGVVLLAWRSRAA